MIMRCFFILLVLLAFVTFSCTRRSGDYTQADRRVQNVRNEQIQPRTRPPRAALQQEKMSASDIFTQFNSAVFMILTSDGWNDFQGSGFFINSSGLAVSNYHVFKGNGMGLESIKLSDGREYKVEDVVAVSEEYDFILFNVDIASSCNYIPITNRRYKVGEKVYAIGSPLGLENTFSSGEISQSRDDYLIQISTPIDHGSSGGALINEYGEVIGITSSGLEDSGANLNFAIDICVIKPYLP